MSSMSSRTHEPRGDRAVGVSDGLAIAENGLAWLKVGQRNFVGLRNALPGDESARKLHSGRNAIGMDDDGYVIPRIHADVHDSILVGACDLTRRMANTQTGVTPFGFDPHL